MRYQRADPSRANRSKMNREISEASDSRRASNHQKSSRHPPTLELLEVIDCRFNRARARRIEDRLAMRGLKHVEMLNAELMSRAVHVLRAAARFALSVRAVLFYAVAHGEYLPRKVIIGRHAEPFRSKVF